MDWSLFSARVFKSSQVVKWVEKGERAPRRKNLGRDGYSGTGVRRSPQNGVLGALENRGARHRLLSHTPTPGCGTGAVQFSPKGTLRGWTATITNGSSGYGGKGLGAALPDKRG